MQPFVKLFALIALLLLPLRVAEAHASPSPDAVIAALDLGHCSGGDVGKQHGRAHAHCPIVGEAIADAVLLDARFPTPLSLAAISVSRGPKGLGPQAATPPPRGF